ncbi:MAG TPA: type VI secretion system baseplate subunit TssE [Gemmatimonadaceae bacterium]|jgi:type VI secretion system protein ImpF|nr:type VI secretion system baseplate subunit TssE [Gemmatimonadaceae bacterium]
MARTELERSVQPSLIDRLTDDEPRVVADAPITREESARRFRQSVQRDVEWLLNTRRTMYPAPDWALEVRRSVYDYGLPDATGLPVGTPAGSARLLAALRDTLERFEPRLAQLDVRLVDADRGRAPQLRFVVEATLLMDPSPVRVVFDTVLEIARDQYEVRDSSVAAED